MVLSLPTLSLLVGLGSASSVASVGSSYSSGFGLTNSYGKLLADLLAQGSGQEVTYDNFAVAGTNVTAVSSEQAVKLNGKQYDAVVLTAGGNDLNYVACLLNPAASFCGRTIDEPEYISRFTGALDSVARNVANSTPIYVVSYTRALSDDTMCGTSEQDCPLTADQVTTAKAIYQKVIDWTNAAVVTWTSKNKHPLRTIPMEKYSVHHAVDSCEPWINGAVSQAASGDGYNWHPNEAGAQFMAQAVFNDLNKQGSPPF